jgi:uncharacterized membrane protein
MYVALISKGAAVLLASVGLFWLTSSILSKRREPEEIEKLRKRPKNETAGRSNPRKFLLVLQLVTIEELEILLVLIPLVLSSYTVEASSAAIIGIVLSLSTAAWLRKRFEKFVSGRLRHLKILSGILLMTLGILLFVEA